MKLLLFDIDGTILLTGGAGRRAVLEAGQGLFGAAFSVEGVSFGGALDPLIFRELLERNGVDARTADEAAYRVAYLQALERNLAHDGADLRLMPGFPHLLDELRGRPDVVVGLLSGNYREGARLKLAAAAIEIDRFPVTAFGDDGPDRPALVRRAIDRHVAIYGNGLEPRDVIVIGDTPHDVSCARAHGCRSLAVATGTHSAAALREAGADLVVADLADPTPLRRLLEA